MLIDDDRAYLESKGWRFEAKQNGDAIYLVIYDYPLPQGYSIAYADLLLQLPRGFPDAAPDMFWFCPDVLYRDGSAPPATGARLEYEGRNWQRWSRHLATAWRPGIDNLQSYLRLIRTDLSTGVSASVAA